MKTATGPTRHRTAVTAVTARTTRPCQPAFAFHPLSLAVLLALSAPAGAVPTGATVVAGQVSVQNPSATQQLVTQSSDKAIIDWKSYSIGANETVRINQPAASAVLLNRVTGYDPSAILGQLQANGRVFLINPYGVVFGAGARVDVGGLVASSLSLANGDFLAGRYDLTSGDATGPATRGAVRNEGRISAPGGTVVLAAPVVSNTGTIEADGGRIGLAAANSVLVDVDGDGLIFFRTDAREAGNRLEQLGRVQADGGSIELRAAARAGLTDTVLNLTGIAQAKSLGQRNGQVVIDGGDSGVTRVAGSVDATGAGAGEQGGRIAVLGHNVLLDAGAALDASGSHGGGTVLVGGAFQGKGPQHNAFRTFVDPSARIKADALGAGNGGQVVVWADDITRFNGAISARGGAASGDGGSVEVSGARLLDFNGTVDTTAAAGRVGKLLLDPLNITIDASGANGNLAGGGGSNDGNANIYAFSEDPGATSNVRPATLNGGTSITLQAKNDITFAAGANGTVSLTTAGAGFTAQAGGNIGFGAGATLTTNGGAIALTANDTSVGSVPTGTGSITGGTAITSKGTIAGAGGTITLSIGAGTGTITVGALDSSGGSAAATAGGAGGNVSLTTANGSIATGTITTSGGAAGASATPLVGGKAGNVTLQIGGIAASTTVPAITATGGAGGAGGAGGDGGAVTVTAAAGSLAASNAITTTGGASTGTAGSNGTIELSAGTQLAVTSALNAGAGTINLKFGQAGGAGNTLDLTSAAAVLTAGTVNATGGTGTSDAIALTNNVNFTLADGSVARSGGLPTINLSGVEVANLTGGAGANTFTISGWSGSGTLNGGGGADTVVDTDDTNFTLADATLTRSGLGTIGLLTIGTATLTGGASANSFTVTGWSGAGTLTAGAGGSTVIAVNDVDMTLTDAALTRGLNVLTLSGIAGANLTGGASANAIVATGFAGNVTVNATAGADTLTGNGANTTLAGTNNNSAWALNAARAGTLTEGANVTTFTGVGRLAGGTGTDTLTGLAAGDTYAITGAKAVSVTTGAVTATSMDALVGGAGDDAFTLAAGATTFNGSIDGGAGTNSLAATDGTNAWSVTGAKAGTLNTSTSFTNIGTLTGGSGTDAFTLATGVSTFNGTIDGGTGSATLAATDGTNAWALTGAQAGTLNTSTSFTRVGSLSGGSGTDTLTGLAAGDSYGITGAKAVSATTAALSATSIDALVGGTGADAFTLATGVTTFNGSIDGGAGANTLATTDGTNAWALTAAKAGTLNTSTPFTNIGALTGGSGADTFTLATGVSTFNGSIDGGTGAATLAATDGTNAWALTAAQAGTLNTTTAFTHIGVLTGGSGTDTLTGLAAGDTYGIPGAKAVTATTGAISATSIEALVGGAGNNTFTLAAGITTFNGSIDGGSGSNTLATTDGTNAWALTAAQAGTLNTTTGFTRIGTLAGGSGADTLTGLAAGDSYSITGAKAVTATTGAVSATSIDALVGGAGNDAFTLAAGVTTFNASIDGGSGTNTLGATDGTNTFTLSAGAAATGALNTSTTFTNIGTLAGGSGTDTLVSQGNTGDVTLSNSTLSRPGLPSTTAISGFEAAQLGGDFGPNAITASGFTGTVDIQATLGTDSATGSGANTTLIGINAGSTWQITGVRAGTMNTSVGTTFSGVGHVVGGNNDDAFTLASGVTTFNGSIDGGAGSNSLIATDGSNAWAITGAKAGTLNSSTAFTNIGTLGGGSGSDAFVLATGVTTFNGSLDGGAGSNTLAATNGTNAWALTVAQAGTLNTTTAFSSVGALTGGSGNDTFTLAAGLSTFNGAIDGGSGSNTLAATDGTNAWVLSAAGAGTLNTTTQFTRIATIAGGTGADTLTGLPTGDNYTITGPKAFTLGSGAVASSSIDALAGGAGNDTFTLAAGVTTYNGTLNGGGGTNTLAATDGTNAWVVTGSKAGTLNATTLFSNFGVLAGGSGSDTLTGLASDSYTITAAKAVTLATGALSATSIDALVGGSGSDSYTLAAGVATFNGSIDGAAGTNTLAATNGTNAWALTGSKAGTLNATTAFSNIAALAGGSGTDTLTGLASDAYTVTAAKAVTLTSGALAATSMDALVAGAGNDTITLAAGVTTFNGSIDGGTGSNTLAATNGANAWALTAPQAGTLNGTTTFTRIGTLAGGSGTDTLTGLAAGDTYTITGARALTAATGAISASSIDALIGGAGDDGITLAAGVAEFNGSIDGGAGSNRLTATNGTNSFALSGPDAGLLNTATPFVRIGNLTGGSGADSYSAAAGATLSGSLSDAGGATSLGGSIQTAGAQHYAGAVTLTSATTLTSTGSGTQGAIDFDSTVGGAQALTLHTAGPARFAGDLGSLATPLASLSVDGGGSVSLKNATTSGPISLGADATLAGTLRTGNAAFSVAGNTTLAGTLTSVSTGSGAIAFGGSVDASQAGVQSLVLNSSGAVSVAGAVGASVALASFSTDATGTTQLGGNVTTTGDQSYGDAVTVAQATRFSADHLAFAGPLAAGAFDIDVLASSAQFLGAVSSGGTLSLAPAASTASLGLAGGSGAFQLDQSQLDRFAGVAQLVLGRADGSGAIRFGNVVLPTATLVRSASGTVDFTGSVDSAPNTAHGLTIATGGLTTFAGNVGSSTALGTVTVANAAQIDAAVTTVGAQAYGGNVALGGNATLSAPTLTLAGTLDLAGHDLAVFTDTLATGAVTGAAGSTVQLASHGAAGSVGIAGGAGLLQLSQAQLDRFADAASLQLGRSDGSGDLSVGSAFTLPTALRLQSATGNVNIASGVDSAAGGAQTLSIQTGGTTTLAGAVGAGRALGALDIGGAAAIGGGSVHTTGAQQYGGAVALGADTTLTGSAVRLAGAVDGAHALTVAAADTTFGSTVGASTALASLTTDAAGTTHLGGSVTTSGAQTYNDALRLDADATLRASTLTVASGVNGAQALTLIANATTLNGAIGSGAALTALAVEGGTVQLNSPTVATTGSQRYAGALALGSDAVLSASAVDFGASVDGAHALTLQSTGPSTFAGNVGALTALSRLTASGGGSVQLQGTAVTTSGAQNYSGALLLAGNAQLQASALTFGGGITGARDLGLQTDALSLTGAIASAVPGSGTLSIAPLTPSLAIGLAGGSGALQVTQALLDGASGFASHHLGRADGSGTVSADALVLRANTVIDTGSGDLRLNGSVDGAFDLALNSGGTTRIAGPVGGTTALRSLATDNAAAADDWNGSSGERTLFDLADGSGAARVTTTGAQTYADPLIASVPLNLAGGTIAATLPANRFDGAVSAQADSLQLRSGTAITLANVSLANGGSVETDGLLQLGGALQLGGGTLVLTTHATPTAGDFADTELRERHPSLGLVALKESGATLFQTAGSTLSSSAGSLLVLRSSNGGSMDLQQAGNSLLGSVSAVTGTLGDSDSTRFRSSNIVLDAVRLTSSEIHVAGAPPTGGDPTVQQAGIEADLVKLSADTLTTGPTGQIRARLPFDNTQGAATSAPALTLVLSPKALAEGNLFGTAAPETWIQVRIGNDLGGFLTVRPKGAGGDNAFVLLGGPLAPTPFYDGNGKLSEVRVFYNGDSPRTAQESGALTAVTAVVEEARHARFEEAVRTENVSSRLRSGVIAEVGAGRPATVGRESIRPPQGCNVKAGTLQCE